MKAYKCNKCGTISAIVKGVFCNECGSNNMALVSDNCYSILNIDIRNTRVYIFKAGVMQEFKDFKLYSDAVQHGKNKLKEMK